MMPPPVTKPDLKAEPWLSLANAIRAKGLKVNPWQLGYAAGLAGMDVRAPYRLQRSADSFLAGMYSARFDPAPAAVVAAVRVPAHTGGQRP